MDFGIASTPEEEAFRQEVQGFLKQESAEIEVITSSRGSYSDDGNEAVRRMARKLGQRGWLSLTWPEEYGGRGTAGIPLKLVFSEETSKVNLPGVNGFGLEMLAPILLANGTEEQK